MIESKLRVGMIPFGGDNNPYQELTRRALVNAGLQVTTFPKSNWFPLWRAARTGLDVLHLDWPHSFYRGKNSFYSIIKRIQFKWQLPRLERVKLVWTVHNLQTHNTGGRGDQPLDWLIKRTDAIVSLSKLGVNSIKERWPAAMHKIIEWVPFGHYCDWYKVPVDRDRCRLILGMTGAKTVAIFFGRIQPYKGLEDLIPVFKDSAGPEDQLVIVGPSNPPEYAEVLQKLSVDDSRIHLKPCFVEKEELEVMLGAADFSVLPFRQIFNSSSLVLALSVGLPVVAPRKGAIPEVTPSEALFDAGHGSRDELGAALSQALHSTDLQKRGAMARKHMLKSHSWDIVGERLSSLYYKICDDTGLKNNNKNDYSSARL